MYKTRKEGSKSKTNFLACYVEQHIALYFEDYLTNTAFLYKVINSTTVNLQNYVFIV